MSHHTLSELRVSAEVELEPDIALTDHTISGTHDTGDRLNHVGIKRSQSKQKPQNKRKKKVEIACVYCRRSHMICDESRPCQRCLKRGIGHLCYDEPSNPRQIRKVEDLRRPINESANSPTRPLTGTPLLADSGIVPLGVNGHIKSESLLSIIETSQKQHGDEQNMRQQNQSQQQLQELLRRKQHQQEHQKEQQQEQQQQHQQQEEEEEEAQGRQDQQQQNTNLTQQQALLELQQQISAQNFTSQTFVQKRPSILSQTLPYNQDPLFYSEHAGSEFSSLNDFLSMIDDPELVNGTLSENSGGNNNMFSFGFNSSSNPTPNKKRSLTNLTGFGNGGPLNNNCNTVSNVMSFPPNASLFPAYFQTDIDLVQQRQNHSLNTVLQPCNRQLAKTTPVVHMTSNQQVEKEVDLPQLDLSARQGPLLFNASHEPVVSDSARDKFFLTAADPTTEISPEERLKQVIKAKLDAGLLQPYNYAKGYARLQGYMENYMNVPSRQRILKPLSIFRPAFRAIARTLKDVDLVLVEESFERMLLDYDRVFTSMAIPACLWRRTGEIYRGNKEFASLVGVTADDLKDGKLAIYELMSEESAVNFWEKYGAIAFDKGQKAVLTSCNLRTKDGIKRKSCCFSFTIRRDRYNIPSCIVGNFIPIDP